MENEKQVERTDSVRIKSLREALFYYRDLSMTQNAEIVDLTKRLASTEKEKESREEELQQVLSLHKSQQQTLVSTIKGLLAEVEGLKQSLRYTENTKAQNEERWRIRWKLQEEKMAEHRPKKESPEKALAKSHQKETQQVMSLHKSQQQTLVSTINELLAEVEGLKQSLRYSENTKAQNEERWRNRWRLQEEKMSEHHLKKESPNEALVRSHQSQVDQLNLEKTAPCKRHDSQVEEFRSVQKMQQEALVSTNKELMAEVDQLRKNLREYEVTKAKNEEDWENRWRLREENMAAEIAHLKADHRRKMEGQNEALVRSHQSQVDRLNAEKTALCRKHDSQVEEFRSVQKMQQEALVLMKKELLAEVDQLRNNLREYEVTKAKNEEDWENRWRLREEKVAAEKAQLKLVYGQEKEELKEAIRDYEGKMAENEIEWANKFKAAEAHLEALKINSSRQRDELLQQAREVEEKNKLDIKVLVDRILHLNSLTSNTKIQKAQKEAARRRKEVEERPEGEKDIQRPSCFPSCRPRLFFTTWK